MYLEIAVFEFPRLYHQDKTGLIDIPLLHMDLHLLRRYSAPYESRIYANQSIFHNVDTYLIAVQSLQSWNV